MFEIIENKLFEVNEHICILFPLLRFCIKREVSFFFKLAYKDPEKAYKASADQTKPESIHKRVKNRILIWYVELV